MLAPVADIYGTDFPIPVSFSLEKGFALKGHFAWRVLL